MKLVSVYKLDDPFNLLYALLNEREPHQNISHKRMPTWEEHTRFVLSRPYRVWYAIVDIDEPVGACYLSKQREIGVFVLRKYRGKGYGAFAVQDMIRRWPGRLLANINPENRASQGFFQKMGFGGPIQYTYEYNAPDSR